ERVQQISPVVSGRPIFLLANSRLMTDRINDSLRRPSIAEKRKYGKAYWLITSLIFAQRSTSRVRLMIKMGISFPLVIITTVFWYYSHSRPSRRFGPAASSLSHAPGVHIRNLDHPRGDPVNSSYRGRSTGVVLR